jgi:hypothetical protein
MEHFALPILKRAVHPAEIGYGAKIRLQVPEKPDHLDVAMRLGFEPSARPDAVDIAINVQLEQVCLIDPRTFRLPRGHLNEAGSGKLEAVNKRLDETDRIVRPHSIVRVTENYLKNKEKKYF